MVRFKVIKGSKLLLGAAIALLILVIGGILLSHFLQDAPKPANTRASLVENTEAKTDTVFASNEEKSGQLGLDPEEIDVEIIAESERQADKPAVLIYHTHTHEAYEQVDSDRYVAVEAWRTTDQDHSVVRVGEELAALLRERGFDVTHDTTDHEQNELKTAYTRSLETLESYEERFDLYIDLHRDAWVDGMEDDTLDDGTQRVARLMLLIGNGEGFSVKPHYEENLAFAQVLTERINQFKPDLCKDVLVKDGRYNQNIGVFSVLIEVGHNRNTLREALNALPYLADGLCSVMIDNPDAQLTGMRQAFLRNHEEAE